LYINNLDGVPFNKKFLAAITSGNVFGSHPMTISICGKEEVSVSIKGIEALYYDIGSAKTTVDVKAFFKS
jgi:hypothetical protein